MTWCIDANRTGDYFYQNGQSVLDLNCAGSYLGDGAGCAPRGAMNVNDTIRAFKIGEC